MRICICICICMRIYYYHFFSIEKGPPSRPDAVGFRLTNSCMPPSFIYILGGGGGLHSVLIAVVCTWSGCASCFWCGRGRGLGSAQHQKCRGIPFFGHPLEGLHIANIYSTSCRLCKNGGTVVQLCLSVGTVDPPHLASPTKVHVYIMSVPSQRWPPFFLCLLFFSLPFSSRH